MYSIYAEATQTVLPNTANFGVTLYMFVVVIGVMYLLVYRPESKRRKQLEKKRAAIQKGDTVIIAGGIISEFVRMDGPNILVKLHDGAKMEVLPMAVQDIVPAKQAQPSTGATSAE